MKNLVKTFTYFFVSGVAYMAGADLWNNVLKDKVENMA